MSGVPERWRPGVLRPPFAPGNTLGQRHGAFSPRRVDPLAAEMRDQLLADAPELAEPRWSAAVWALARAEARAQLVTEYLLDLAGGGLGDLDDARVMSAYALSHRFEAHATQLRGRLGLDPLSRARLGRDVASAQVDVALVMKRLHEEQVEREQVNAERSAVGLPPLPAPSRDDDHDDEQEDA